MAFLFDTVFLHCFQHVIIIISTYIYRIEKSIGVRLGFESCRFKEKLPLTRPTPLLKILIKSAVDKVVTYIIKIKQYGWNDKPKPTTYLSKDKPIGNPFN